MNENRVEGFGADLADRWLAARNDPAAIEAFAREVLDRLGGPLVDGYLAVAPRPETSTPEATTPEATTLVAQSPAAQPPDITTPA